MRYISHEIRTPLNTVSLGLELLQKKLQAQEKYWSSLSPSNSFRIQSNQNNNENNNTNNNTTNSDNNNNDNVIEMSQEIYDSCHIALDIVNDLLFYDKIEEGKLILYKQKLNGCDLISETIRTFSLQVSVLYFIIFINIINIITIFIIILL